MAAYYISSKSVKKFVRKLKQKFMISHTTVTLNESEGHQNLHQMKSSSLPIIISSLKEIGLYISKHKLNINLGEGGGNKIT